MSWLNTKQRAENLAKARLSTNNGINSISNNVISILEWGDGALEMRNYITHALWVYWQNAWLPDTWKTLNKLVSIKDQIAYMVWETYAQAHTLNTSYWSAWLNEKHLNAHINRVINDLESRLFAHQDFSESWIVRHAAYNTFEAKLTPQERQKLTQLAAAVKKAAADGHAEDIANNMHLHQESDAQKMIKILESIDKLWQRGISIDADSVAMLESLDAKFEPLKNLDKKYKYLTKMHHMVHSIGKASINSMISETKKQKLFAVLGKVWRKPEDFIIDESSTDTIQNKLSDILHDKNRTELNAALNELHITRKEFSQWFLAYFAFASVEDAKRQLDDAKQKAFGHKLPRFENNVNRWRGSARQRLLNIADRMDAAGDFATDADYHLASNYFDTFKSILYADPDVDIEVFNRMRKLISAVIRRRVPSVSGTQNLRPALHRVLRRVNGTRGNVYNSARDDAEIFATIIMWQAQSSQDMYYETKTENVRESFRQRIAKTVWRTEIGRQSARDFVKPWLKWLLRFWENAARHTWSLVWNVVAGGSKLWTTWLGNMNRWTEKKFHWLKLPFYVAWPVTYTVEKWLNLTNWAALWLMTWGAKMRQSGVEALQRWSGDENVTHLVDWVWKSLDAATSLITRPISRGWNKWAERIETNEHKKVLWAFYEAAATDSNIKSIMQSTALANMINIEDFWPYIYDEDGRIPSTNIVEQAPKDTPDGVIKELSSVFKKQVEKIEAELSVEHKEMTAEVKKISTWDDIEKTESILLKQQALNEWHLKMRELIVAIREASRDVGSTFTTNSQSAINTLLTEIRDINASMDITTLQTNLNTKQKEIDDATTEITTLDAKVKYYSAKGTYSDIELQNATNEKKIQIDVIQKAKTERSELFSQLQVLRKVKAYLSFVEREIDAMKDITDKISLTWWWLPDTYAKDLSELLKNLDLSMNS